MASVNYQKLGFVTNRTHLPSPTPSFECIAPTRVQMARAWTQPPPAVHWDARRNSANNSLEVFEVF